MEMKMHLAYRAEEGQARGKQGGKGSIRCWLLAATCGPTRLGLARPGLRYYSLWVCYWARALISIGFRGRGNYSTVLSTLWALSSDSGTENCRAPTRDVTLWFDFLYLYLSRFRKKLPPLAACPFSSRCLSAPCSLLPSSLPPRLLLPLAVGSLRVHWSKLKAIFQLQMFAKWLLMICGELKERPNSLRGSGVAPSGRK